VATNYPGSLDTTTQLPNNRSDATTSATSHAQDHDNLADSVLAVETELGATPKGSFTNLANRLNARLTCRKTANTTNATTTAANITDLTLPVNTTAIDYWFRFFVIYQSNTAGVSPQFAVTTPAVTGYVYYWIDVMGGTATVPGVTSTNAAIPVAMTSHNASASAQTITGGSAASPPAAATNYGVRIEGVLSNPSATGSIVVQGKAETTGTITFMRGSWGEVYIN
jgi:hypothetical protein